MGEFLGCWMGDGFTAGFKAGLVLEERGEVGGKIGRAHV